MGHTNRSQRVNTDMLLHELRQFARGLPQEDRDVANGLIPVAQRYMGGITQAGSSHGWATVLFSMLVEQEKRMNRMEDALRGLADR